MWYNVQANPRSTVHVLQTLDESSYDFQPHPFIRNWGTLMGEDHPITWCQLYDGGPCGTRAAAMTRRRSPTTTR